MIARVNDYSKSNFCMRLVRYLLIFSLCVMFSACGDRKTLVDVGNEKGILYLGNAAEPADIDPHITTGSPEHNIQTALYEGLVTKDLETLEPKPGVADSWSVSEDGRVYRFHIRDTARWSNGDKLVAQDFVDTWRRELMPKLGSAWAVYLFVIVNAEAFNKGEISDFSQVGVKALDEETLEITLVSSTPYFLQMLDHNSMFPLHIKTIEKFGEIDERSTPWTRPENFVGNGPFIPVEWTPNKVFSVKKNPYYWNTKSVKLNQIDFLPIDNLVVQERMYRNGQLHIVEKLPPDKIAQYQSDPALRTFLNYATYFYRLNTTIKPLDDARVRKALAYSINREAIAKYITKGGEIPAYSLTPPNYYYAPQARMVYDIDLAKKLLAEAGYPDGKGFPKLTLIYNTDESHLKIAVAIQQMWKKSLGVDIKLQNQEWKVFLNNQHQMNYEISRASWSGDYVDPNTFLEMWITDGGNNETGWANKEYDSLIRQASLAQNKAQRVAYFQRAEHILMDESPIIPIYNYSWNRLVSPSVKGWVDNIQDFYQFQNITLVPSEN